MTDWIIATKNLFDQGGYVMPPLFLCAMALWYGIGYRYSVLRIKNRLNIRDLYTRFKTDPIHKPRDILEHAMASAMKIKTEQRDHLRRHLDEVFYGYQQEISRYGVLVKVIVMISPLLGLLGTVSGMIETFDSLAEMALFTQSGGIAGGVSQALLTTQTGLAVAIPGVLMQVNLMRKQRNIETQLAQIIDLICIDQQLKP